VNRTYKYLSLRIKMLKLPITNAKVWGRTNIIILQVSKILA